MSSLFLVVIHLDFEVAFRVYLFGCFDVRFTSDISLFYLFGHIILCQVGMFLLFSLVKQPFLESSDRKGANGSVLRGFPLVFE